MSPAGPRPTVSIIVATYNRSNVLKLAIESAIAQTFADWEMWVIGDACTDDTKAVIEAFRDERIRFHNLPENCGDQSGPNNEGVRQARGRYVAYLNHDDLWFHDHLERCVLALEEDRELDGVFAVQGQVRDGDVTLKPSWSGRLESGIRAPASGWLIREETIRRVGLWRARHESFDAPSRDWLVRAGHAGCVIRQLPVMTLLICPSTVRPGSYLRRDDEVQRNLWSRMQVPGFREELLHDIAVRASAEVIRARPTRTNLHRTLHDAVARALGVRASTVKMAIRYRRRGGLVDHLRKLRGLE